MSNEIVIVDYGMANLRSVQKAFEKVGHAADHHRRPEPHRRGRQGRAARRRRLPRRHRPAARGRSGRADQWTHPRRQAVPRHLPGPATAVHASYEDGDYAGLDLLPGEVVRFPDQPGLKVPHMGWNQLRIRRPSAAACAALPTDASVYFVHSYYVQCRATRA